ncbi:MAG: type II toxin-antitoxin system RatA family toxin [Gammaproteobacteria bacterium]|nr:type II toxin-antitoxin system RatA family toxin [Gammaproteobacteria bacterium]
MKVVRKNALVPYRASQMYELVKDVERYPEFLPWCGGARIEEKFDDGVVGSVDINKGKVQKTFTTRNHFIKDSEITLQLVNGPFSQLQGAWSFDPIGEQGCRVSLYLEFDFNSTLASMTIGPVFNLIADKLLDAFVEEADRIYG